MSGSDTIDRPSPGHVARLHQRSAHSIPSAHAPREYVPFEKTAQGRREIGLRICLTDHREVDIRYCFITRILRYRDTDAAIVCTDCVIRLQGRKLEEMLNLLCDERIIRITQYDPARFHASSEDAPCLDHITLEGRDTGELLKSLGQY